MDALITYISSHFLESLVIGLLTTLFFKETIVAWFYSHFGIGPTPDQRLTLKMANDMTALKMHFNDETTHLLTDIQVNLSKQSLAFDEFGKSQIIQSGKLDEMRDILRDFQRNGIRIRN